MCVPQCIISEFPMIAKLHCCYVVNIYNYIGMKPNACCGKELNNVMPPMKLYCLFAAWVTRRLSMCIGMANWSDTKVFIFKHPLIAVRIVRMTTFIIIIIYYYIFLCITLNIILLQGINILFIYSVLVNDFGKVVTKL